MVAVVVMPADRFGQILNIRQLACLRGVGKVRRQLAQLIGLRRVPGLLGRTRSRLQIRRDLLRHLLILRRIGLL